jgi:class 3 adenylate cyclase
VRAARRPRSQHPTPVLGRIALPLLAVATGARIAALAQPSQVLVSQTVKDLVAGNAYHKRGTRITAFRAGCDFSR